MLTFSSRNVRTLDPPTLRQDHYLRRWLSHLGMVVARRSLITIIITVVIGIGLCVPFLYHTTSFGNDLNRLGHAWTSAESFANGESLVSNISIRQFWIHGSWMKALERETLLEAVAIQDILLGPMTNCSTMPWHEGSILKTPADADMAFFHSPLLLWNCSTAALESDNSILMTINSGARQVSPANMTLRPSSVLAGTLLSFNKLVAADALAMSLFYRAESAAGDLFDDRAELLAQHNKSRWAVYPANGRATRSRLFRFQSRAASVQDKGIVFSVYSLVALYIVFNLRNLRTLKSKVGLFLAIALQVSISSDSKMQ
jgi:hypothetical protein